MLHRINKLQFETICATEAQAFEVRNNFTQTYQEQIAEVIDKVCSRYVSENEWIQIDRIEVDLEKFSLQEFEKNFTTGFLNKFEKEFSQQILSIPVAEKTSSRQISQLKLLVYFLQNGTLPWWADAEEIDINTVLMEVAQQHRKALCDFLEQHCFTEVIWQRIAMQFNAKVYQFILSIFPILAEAEKGLTQWISLFFEETKTDSKETLSISPPVIRIQKFVLMHAPVFFKAHKENVLESYLIRCFAEEFMPVANANSSLEEITEKITERILANKNGTIQINRAEVATTEEEQKTKTLLSFDKAEEMKAGLFPAEIKQTQIKAIKENKKNDINTVLAKEEEIHAEKFTVYTAGVVLLAPYLKQLFSHLHLLEHDEWKNRDAHYKAIHLVRYLATGQEMCPEYSLVLEKLLCGMEINAPIPQEVELSEEEKAEATELLKSVIANWPKLKNTSVAGLRETFLKRDGILRKKENGWLLQVEKKTPDVLLESIPWGFSTLIFSWTDYTIFTEW